MLNVARCLDEGHDWRLMSTTVEQKGKLRGVARREKLCQRCSGLKIEHIAWNGMVLNRVYKSNADYIGASRELAHDVQERRIAYRKMWLEAAFKPAARRRAEDVRAVVEEEGW